MKVQDAQCPTVFSNPSLFAFLLLKYQKSSFFPTFISPVPTPRFAWPPSKTDVACVGNDVGCGEILEMGVDPGSLHFRWQIKERSFMPFLKDNSYMWQICFFKFCHAAKLLKLLGKQNIFETVLSEKKVCIHFECPY